MSTWITYLSSGTPGFFVVGTSKDFVLDSQRFLGLPLHEDYLKSFQATSANYFEGNFWA